MQFNAYTRASSKSQTLSVTFIIHSIIIHVLTIPKLDLFFPIVHFFLYFNKLVIFVEFCGCNNFTRNCFNAHFSARLLISFLLSTKCLSFLFCFIILFPQNFTFFWLFSLFLLLYSFLLSTNSLFCFTISFI